MRKLNLHMPAPIKPHVIEDTRMRSATDEYWTLCRCGYRVTVANALAGLSKAETLAQEYALHIAETRGTVNA